MVEPLRHRQTKGAETDMPGLPQPRHIPTLRNLLIGAGCGEGSLTEPIGATQLWEREVLFMPRTVVQEGTLNEDRVEFRLATFSDGGCRRVSAADGRR